MVAQSAEVVHAVGQGSYVGFKQTPLALKLGSTVFADVQQISPLVVSQSVLVPHAFGQRLAGVQNGVE
jgi:hypothetical protein